MSKIIIASGPVIVENGKILLDKQGTDDFWKFCGGKVRENETLADTATRRSKEELGIGIELIEDMPFISYTTKETSEGIVDVILVHFLSKRIGEVDPGEEVHEWGWFDINSLPENLAPNIKPVIEYFNLA